MASFVNPFAVDESPTPTPPPAPERLVAADSPRGSPAEFAFRSNSGLGAFEQPKPPSHKANPQEEKKVLLNMIMQHLEAEGFHTAAGVVRNDYVSQFGAVSTATGAAAKQTNLLKVVAGRLPAPIDNPPRLRSVSGGSAIVPPVLSAAGGAGTNRAPQGALPSLPQTAAPTDGTISLGGGISLMDALTGAGGVAAAFGSAPAAEGRRLRGDTGGDADLDVTIPAPPANPNVKWDTTTGQAARTRKSAGADAEVHVIRSAPLDASVAHAAYMVVTSDQARRGGRTSSGIEIVVGPDGEDLLFSDILLMTVPRTLRKAGSKGQGPWDVFLQAVGTYLTQLMTARESSGGILVLGLLQFFLERHALRVGHGALPSALQTCRSLALRVQRAMPLWEAEHQDFRTATIRGLRDIAMLLQSTAAAAAARGAYVALDNYGGGVAAGGAFSALAVAAAHSPWHRVPREQGAWIRVPPASMAAAWTLVDHALFASIPTEDWLGGGWDDSRWQHSADSILRFVDRYQSIAFWTASQVVWAARGGRGVARHVDEQGGPADRAAMVVRIVTLAQALHKLRNFSTLAALLTGLRLKGLPQLLHATWALVPSSTTAAISSLSSIVSDDQQYKLYHVATQSIEARQAIVPHLAPHTSALTLLAGSHVPDRLDRGGGDFDEGPPSAARGPPSLHFHKWRNVWATVLGRLVDWQARRYTDDELQGGVATVLPLCLLLGDELRRCRFQFDDDREAAVTELVHLAEALEPALPPPPPPVQYDDEGYPIDEGGDGEYYEEEHGGSHGGAGGDDSDEEVPWYSTHFTVVE